MRTKILTTIILTVAIFLFSNSKSFSFTILDEATFFTQYTKSALITDFCWNGDGSCPNSWIVRGYKGGGFWNRVNAGNPYPILLDPSGPSNYSLSLMAPSVSSFSAIPIAVYTDMGFKGVIPSSQDDKFYPLYANEITAVYTVAIIQHPSLIIRAGSGTGSIISEPSGINCGNICTANFNINTSITLTATPDTGSTFSGWSGACTGTGVCTVTIDAPKTITATFTLNTYAITATAGINGTISQSAAVNHGTTTTFTITPNTGYHIADVVVDGIPVGAVSTYIFNNVTASHAITATFILEGDLDMSGAVDLTDAIIALQTISSLQTITPVHKAADIDGDNKIGLAEAIYALQSAARLRNNHSPVLNIIGNKSVNENTMLTFKIVATDSDGDTQTYSATNLPYGALMDSKSGTFSWIPSFVQSGAYQVTFVVDDGYGGTDSETVMINVVNVNRTPVLNAIGNKSVDQNMTLSFTTSAIDSDGDTLTYSASSLPNGATFNAATRTFTWTPAYSQSGTYSVTFTVSDGRGGTDSETITITVMDKTPVFTASDYFPLNVEDWRDYYLNTIGNVRRSSIIGTKVIGGVTTKIVSQWNGDTQYYTSDQNGLKLYGGYSAAQAFEMILNPPLLQIPNNAQIGASNVSNSQYLYIYSGYTYHVNVTSTVIILGLEDIQTEHNLLRDCIKISRKTDQYVVETGESVPGNTNYYWFYKGVGTVKQMIDGDTYTITSSSINGVIQNY